MNREYHRWYSPHLHREIELLVFGHAGEKVLAFPTRDGRFYEYENLGIINAANDKIHAGQIQIFCVENLAQENFYARQLRPVERIKGYLQFEQYILAEVMPFMERKNSNPCTIALGCSLGAFHAANIAFRYPNLFQKLFAFSGRYDLTLAVEHFRDLFDGYYDDDIYFNTPTHFLTNLDCDTHLQYLREMEMVFTIGKEDPFLANNHHLSQILWSKNIAHSLFEWNGRAHRGKDWRKMVNIYLNNSPT